VAAKGRSIKGLRGRWFLQDSVDKDTGFAVSLWESAADMQAYEQSDVYRGPR
jgi:heme-degrading monooxygenase HmoA